MNKSISTVLKTSVLVSTIIFSSCKKDDTTPKLEIPSTYDNSAFAANAATQIAVVDQVNNITTEAKKGRLIAKKLDKTIFDNLFSSVPNLSTIITPYYKAKLEGPNGWYDEIAKASGNSYVPSEPISGAQGGVFGTGTSAYLYDENGLEIEQLIEKGMFGAVLYKHATDLMAGSITSSTPDQLIAIFGATPSFSNSSSTNVAIEVRDKAMANYAARRDKADGKGLYTQIKTQFIKLQAAIKGGNSFNKDRDEALAEIRNIWEKVNAATIINYCHAVTTIMSSSSTTDNQKSSALHAYGECVGFTHGWKTIPQNYKKITDNELDEVLVLLNAPHNATPTSYKFITEPLTELPKLTQIINKLKNIYGFSDQDILDFKLNWITTQNR